MSERRAYTIEMKGGGHRTVEVPAEAVVKAQHHPGGDGGSLSVAFTLPGSMAEDPTVVAQFFEVRAVYRDDVTVERSAGAPNNPPPRILNTGATP